MLRSDVVNALASMFDQARYLEIGVWRGDTFKAVQADAKTAVDPKIEFDYEAYRTANPGSVFFPSTSDDFFHQSTSRDDKFDVIFIDGLHTFEQTLIDLLHSLDRCREGGVIVIDDVMPDSYAASMPTEGQCYRFRQINGDPGTHWMGDVYKIVFFVNSLLLNWSYATVQETHGQTVLWREARAAPNSAPDTLLEVANKTYADVALHKSIFNVRPMREIIDLVKASGRGAKGTMPIARGAGNGADTTRRKISFYFERIEDLVNIDDIPEMIKLHVESFERLGWELVPLSEQDARRHPLFGKFDDVQSPFNQSRNGWEYTRACYMRWLAYAVAGHYFADFDIINYGLTPGDADEIRRQKGAAKLLSGAGAAGLFIGDEYQIITDAFTRFADNPVIEGALLDDVNDMNVLIQTCPEIFSFTHDNDVRVARDYSCPGWEVAKLVHFPYHYVTAPRSKTVTAMRPI